MVSAIDHLAYLLAQTTHGPGMHGPVLVALILAAAAVGGVVYFFKTRTGRARSQQDPVPERDPENDTDLDA